MKKFLLFTVGALAAGIALASSIIDPVSVGVLMAMGASAMPPSVGDAFAKLFQPVEQFPRWFQPNKNIGPILVRSQEEEDELKARDWSPKPLPGSETAPKRVLDATDIQGAMDQLEAEKALFEAKQREWEAKMDAMMALVARSGQGGPAYPGTSSVLSAVAAPAVSPEAATAALGLSDASDSDDDSGASNK